jgi:hypothetical protein
MPALSGCLLSGAFINEVTTEFLEFAEILKIEWQKGNL